MSKLRPPARTVSGFGGDTATRLGNAFWELALGISTRGLMDIDYPDSVFYGALPYAATRSVLRQLDLRPTDTFVDVGCGKGRILCCAARRPIAEAIGVEVSGELCEDARANAARLHGRKAPITVHHLPAQEFDYAKASVLFLFNPFGAETMNQVLTKIRTDIAGRPLRIAYTIPTHAAVFADHDWLEPYQPAGAAERDWVAFFRTPNLPQT